MASRTARHASGEGVITGYVLKVVRESLDVSQERLAEILAVDPHTVQAWESGRRPLMATQVRAFVDLCQRLRMLGARPELVESLTTALDADHLLTYCLNAEEALNLEEHPLTKWVLTRQVSHMLMWPLTGRRPSVLRQTAPPSRRGPVPSGPSLSWTERARVFEHLQATAQRSMDDKGGSEEAQLLLRRQAYYHLAWSTDARLQHWLAEAQRQEQRRLPRAHEHWSPSWVAARSLAVALARLGDKEPLRAFIRDGLASDACILADLHYWAYWVGETGHVQHADDFMTEDPGPWATGRLLRRLNDRLASDSPWIDLYVHSLWGLVQYDRSVLDRDLPLRAELYEKLKKALDCWELSHQSRKELESVLKSA